MTDDANIDIRHHDHAEGGAFYVEEQAIRRAEMTYDRVQSDVVVVDHTYTHESLRGQGMARKLLDALVAWARTTGTRVVATCTYARGQFERDASIRDVYAGHDPSSPVATR